MKKGEQRGKKKKTDEKDMNWRTGDKCDRKRERKVGQAKGKEKEEQQNKQEINKDRQKEMMIFYTYYLREGQVEGREKRSEAQTN